MVGKPCHNTSDLICLWEIHLITICSEKSSDSEVIITRDDTDRNYIPLSPWWVVRKTFILKKNKNVILRDIKNNYVLLLDDEKFKGAKLNKFFYPQWIERKHLMGRKQVIQKRVDTQSYEIFSLTCVYNLKKTHGMIFCYID